MSFLQEDKDDFARFLEAFKPRAVVDAKTYDLFVGYLKHNRDAQGPDPGAAKSYKTYVLRCFYWNEERGCVLFRSGNREVVTKDKIYDLISTKHLEASHLGAESLYQRLGSAYYGIPREAVRDVVRRCRKCFPHSGGDGLPRGNRKLTRLRAAPAINGGGADGQTEVDPSSHSDADSESLGNADHVESRLPWTSLDELRQWIEWLQHMKNRDWPQDLEYSRYRSTISGLCTILETARPADAYIESLGDSVYSAPYDSADLLCLTMQQAMAELDKTEGPATPIFVRHDVAMVKGLRTINSYLHFMRDWLFTTMAVEKLSRRRNQTSGARWPLGKVIQRFGEAGSELPPEEQPPISVLDLGSIESDVVPECFGAEAMKSLRKRKTVSPWRPTQSLTSVEKWVLLAQRGSGTMTHQDHDSFWTWVMVEEGEKLWMICRLTEDDRKSFAEEGSAFTGGQWFYVWLKPGDVLIMPPGTVHAVFTPVDTLCVGGNARARRHVDTSAMGEDVSESIQPGITADGRSVARLEDLIIKLSRQLASATSGDPTGTRGSPWTKVCS
jgi:Cupin superfamily protein